MPVVDDCHSKKHLNPRFFLLLVGILSDLPWWLFWEYRIDPERWVDPHRCVYPDGLDEEWLDQEYLFETQMQLLSSRRTWDIPIRFVAAMTYTRLLAWVWSTPSISVNSWLTTRAVEPVSWAVRRGHKASISSKKITHGLESRARWKTCRTARSLSPTY